MIYQAGPPEPAQRTIEDVIRNGVTRSPEEDRDLARLLHDAMCRGQATSEEVMAEVEQRFRFDPKFHAQVKIAVGVMDQHQHLKPGEEGVALAAAAVALVIAEQNQEKRDRELLARHFRALASAEGIEDWPGYLLDVAAGHAAGTSWYRP
jgi:hypothetical protein